MSRPANNYNLLIQKLDRFIRKFYVNKLIKGVLYTIGLILLCFLAISITEYYFYFSTTIRKVLFYGFLGISGIATLGWVLIPLLHYFKLGKVISHEQAADIIGLHFGNVKDKLLNILQLKNQSVGLTDASLIEASIDQKADEISPVPFQNAINLAKNKTYLKYALIPLLFFLGILFLAPSLIKDSTERLINNDQEFEREAPFHFSVKNENLEVVQFEDLLVDIKVEGSVLPNEAFIHINNFPYKLKKTGASTFEYKFNKLQKATSFFLEADGFKSKLYDVKVIPKPSLLSFDATIDYPSYTEHKDEVLRNSGDMVVPTGTKVTWSFEAQNTDKIQVQFAGIDSLVTAKRNGEKLFTLSKRFRKDSPYTLYLSNEKIANADSISYSISVTPDLYPSINAEEKRDSSDVKYLYFIGDASDDYGIKSLSFKYKIDAEEKGRGTSGYQSESVDASLNRRATSFTHSWDLNSLGLKPGDKLTYYFEVWDNDGVNGSKYARSQMMSYELPTIDELDEIVEEKNEELKEDLKDMMEEAKELREDAKDIQEKLIQQKDMQWEDKAQIQELMKQHKQMQQKIQKTQENYKENLKQQDEYKSMSEELQEKHEKIQEMMEELMSEEMKELMEKLESLLEEMDKEEIMEELEDFEMTDEQLEDELDRMLELFKQLEFEQKMEETIDKLQELAEEQEELAEETEQDEDGDLSDQEEKQEEIDEEFEKLKEDMEQLQEMSDELKNDMDLQSETEEMQDQISKSMENSMQEMESGDQSGAGKEQQDASDQMQEMADKMMQMQMQQQQEQMEEDMQAIRQLLENLINLSIDQEDLMEEMAVVSVNTPRFTDLVQNQFKIKDDAELVEDSLVALSKRVFELEAFITKELGEINRNLDDALDYLGQRLKPKAATNQQFIMTSLNNLALMLSEVMQQMQQQMAQQMQGSQMCQKPGNMPGMKGMGKMQSQLNDQIKQLQEMGKKPGGKSPGKMSKEAAQLAAKQQALRQALEQISKDNNKDGNKSMGDLEELAKEMEETETDLVNKRITSELISRQQEILDKLLKAERAEKERELDDKRLAQTAQQKTRKVPPSVEEYLKKRQAEIELYKTVPPALKPFYKEMVERYFQSISF